MFGLLYGKTVLHEVVMKDGQVQHLHKIDPATGDHFIPESETEKVESLLIKHLGAHVYDSETLKLTGRTVGEHYTSPDQG